MKRFLNSRATIDRLSEGSVWHGWVSSIDPHEIRISSNDPPNMMAMEVCELHLATARNRADFKAEYKLKMGSIVVFSLPRVVRLEVSEDPFRVQVFGSLGRVRYGVENVPIRMIDANFTGFGFELEQPIDPGALVDIAFESDCGTIEASGQVVYCMSQGDEKPNRAGMKILSISRVSRARLDRLVSANAA